ncbi:MAG: glutamate-5-semialdehyde dehydrogenase, partial [Bacteroidales bacterium]|nr:glutamate-5-semialdehyde dehydrogenase [Bacteroidales bacterium]
MEDLAKMGKTAREAAFFLGSVSSEMKDRLLNEVAGELVNNQDMILKANKTDMDQAGKNGLSGAILDRLLLNETRISGMSEGLREIALLEDPVGEVLEMKKRPNGLLIGKKRVPLGVIGIIYESRPNVTADVFGLCIKTGNASLLRGGKEAIHTNKAIATLIKQVISRLGFPEGTFQLVEDTSRETATKMMRLNDYLDILIPRGGAGLIQSVVQNSTVPVIETGTGNCHIYIDSFADLEMAVNITVNAKTQRPGVCNAAETVLVHESVAAEVIPILTKELQEKGVEIRGDEAVKNLVPGVKRASEEDWDTEYLDLIITAGVVGSLEDAISHINQHGSGHSECIVTENYTHAQQFLSDVDAAAVYVNASTRFTDGFEFGYGAEIGISTQKLHARGPMGLKELTT